MVHERRFRSACSCCLYICCLTDRTLCCSTWLCLYRADPAETHLIGAQYPPLPVCVLPGSCCSHNLYCQLLVPFKKFGYNKVAKINKLEFCNNVSPVDGHPMPRRYIQLYHKSKNHWVRIWFTEHQLCLLKIPVKVTVRSTILSLMGLSKNQVFRNYWGRQFRIDGLTPTFRYGRRIFTVDRQVRSVDFR